MTSAEPIKLLGAAGSPYTRKMLSLMRYRRIPHAILWGSHRNPPPGMPPPKVQLLPTFYFPTGEGGVEAVVDSSPIIRRLEREHAGRSVIPDHPALAFFAWLIEDYADEWLTKPMFHYRWTHQADIDNAGPMLIFWHEPRISDEEAAPAAQAISQRQIDRLFVVGSNAATAQTIEDSYKRFVAILDSLIAEQGYILGARPSCADFAVFGQLTQLAVVEPTSAAATTAISRRVRAWVDRMEDLSGLEPTASDWLTADAGSVALRGLFSEIGRVYAPFLVANAQAAMSGAATVETEIDGRRWTQPTFPYQARCLQMIREEYARLRPDDRALVARALDGTGCEPMLADI